VKFTQILVYEDEKEIRREAEKKWGKIRWKEWGNASQRVAKTMAASFQTVIGGVRLKREMKGGV